MQIPMDDAMTGVSGLVQDARPSAAPGTAAPSGPWAAKVRRAAEGETLNRARSFVHMQPLTIVLGAAGAGLLLGLALGRRRS